MGEVPRARATGVRIRSGLCALPLITQILQVTCSLTLMRAASSVA